MYRHDDEDSYVVLGLPCKKPHQAKKNGLESWESAKSSKVGGYAIWHDTATAPLSISQLPACKICDSRDNLLLVCQLFAPAEVDRSLYIFCCNKRECSLNNNGWIVIRNQVSSVVVTKKTDNAVEAFSSPSANTSTAPPSSTVWNFINNSNEEDDDDDDDLLTLLQARNKSLNVKPVVTNPTSPAPKTANKPESSSFLLTNTTLPIFPIEEVDEQWDAEYEEEDIERFGQKVDSNHINKLIESYLVDEDDEDTLLALKATGMNINKEVVSVEKKKKATKLLEDEDEDDEGDNEEESEEGPVMKSHHNNHSNNNKDKVEEYFQKRVSLESKQVLRYALEGEPLWISSPNPLDGKGSHSLIPPCAQCGCARVFECQLMPALLSYITVTEPAANQSASSATTVASKHQLSEALGSGLDYGVVTIWTCPKSCATTTNTFATEIVIVQSPPPDFM